MRALGALNISVGTSLAFELADINTLLKVQSVMVNLRTLVRNAIEAYPAEDPDGKDPDLISAAVNEDLKGILNYFKEKVPNNPITFILYYPSYKSLGRLFPNAKLWVAKTPLQLERQSLTNKVIDLLKKKLKGVLIEEDCTPPKFNGNGLILTHHPVDLALNKSYNRLKLLESYTGMIKTHTQWYTKLTGADKLFNIPMNKLTIQVFGDKSVNFLSMSPKIKTLVESIALRGKWTSESTTEKVRSSIATYAEGFDRSALLDLLK